MSVNRSGFGEGAVLKADGSLLQPRFNQLTRDISSVWSLEGTQPRSNEWYLRWSIHSILDGQKQLSELQAFLQDLPFPINIIRACFSFQTYKFLINSLLLWILFADLFYMASYSLAISSDCNLMEPAVSMRAGQFRATFCSETAALRRKGSDHCLWSCRPHEVGSPGPASPGCRLRACDHQVSEWNTAGQSHNFRGLETVSPWLVPAGSVSLKPQPKICPAITIHPFIRKHKSHSLHWKLLKH